MPGSAQYCQLWLAASRATGLTTLLTWLLLLTRTDEKGVPHVATVPAGERPVLDDLGIHHHLNIHVTAHNRNGVDPQTCQVSAHNQLWCHTLAMEDRAEGLQKVPATDDAQQLSPGTATGMAIGAEIEIGRA